MRLSATFLLVLSLAFGCREPEEIVTPPMAFEIPPPPTEAHPDLDLDNLLNIAYGASVVSRTAELSLEQSAVHAIDGLGTSVWSSPPAGQNQTLLFALPTESRIERLGVSTVSDPNRTADEFRFELSNGGEFWREVLVLKPDPAQTTQLQEIIHSRATHIRVTTAGKAAWILIRSVHAVGHELAPLTPRSIPGCWNVNETPGRFTQSGASLSGSFGDQRPVITEGGLEGPVVRLMWMKGPAWGYAALTLAPDNRTFSALTFHEEVVVEYAGAAWFGERVETCASTDYVSHAGRFLQRARRWSMFGLSFDEQDQLVPGPSAVALDMAASLIAASPEARFAVVVHEYRAADALLNRRRASTRLDAIRTALAARNVDLSRVAFEAAGSDRNIAPVTLTIQRLMASRADLELR